MSLFGRRSSWWGPPASLPPSRHALAPGETAIDHALQALDDVFSNQWRMEFAEYTAVMAELATLAPGDPRAEALLRQAAGFISRASIHLATQRCSCRIQGWVHAETVSLHTQAVRLLGAPAAIAFEPTWKPL